MNNIIRSISELERARIKSWNTPSQAENQDNLLQAVENAIHDEGFMELVKITPDQQVSAEKKPGFLLAIGMKLMIQYYHARFSIETGEPMMSSDDAETYYYAASSFIHASQLAGEA